MKGCARLLTAVGLIAAGLSPVVGADKKDDAARREFDKLEGRWALVSANTGGKELPPDRLKSQTYEFTQGTMSVLVDGKVLRKAGVKLNPNSTPPQIDLAWESGGNKGVTQEGLYRLEGDRLTLCVAISRTAGTNKARPAEYKAGEGVMLSVFRKAK